jgi:hypothetical protein
MASNMLLDRHWFNTSPAIIPKVFQMPVKISSYRNSMMILDFISLAGSLVFHFLAFEMRSFAARTDLTLIV